MKFKATDNINLRSGPSVNSPKIGSIPAGSIIESDDHTWKAVTLSDGTKGYCAATYLVTVQETVKAKWFIPIRKDKFVLTQKFLEYDSVTYTITKHHPGVDYGTQGEDNVPLYFCADGEIIESGFHPQFGNFFFLYVPEVNKTFVYFHLCNTPPIKGQYKGGVQAGIAGKTGKSKGIHLHLECMKGKKTSTDRASLYTSKDALVAAAEDADAFIRARL